MAPTGRKTVAPGQPISSSSWGNLVWDQSIECFASAADRDNQYPQAARHPGAPVYLEDVKVLQYWDGAAWQPFAPIKLSLGSTVFPTWGAAFPAGHCTAPPEALFPRIEDVPG